MKQFGVCSVLITCCLAAPARAEKYGEQELADGIAPLSQPQDQIQVAPEDNYAPWQIYGNGNPYGPSALALYNAWPQVCTDGLWDNYCNEQHCHCYKGPHQHGGHCGFGNQCGAGNQSIGCNDCGTAAFDSRNRHFQGKRFVPVNSVRGNCATSTETEGPQLEMQPAPEPTLQPQTVPSPPSEEELSSARLLPRKNPVRQPLLPANWRGEK
jgi:hypothetical protein